jgi:hypothetical protein
LYLLHRKFQQFLLFRLYQEPLLFLLFLLHQMFQQFLLFRLYL